MSKRRDDLTVKWLLVLLLLLLAACNLTSPLSSSDTPVPSTPQDLNSIPTVGYLDMPYLGGDAGHVSCRGRRDDYGQLARISG